MIGLVIVAVSLPPGAWLALGVLCAILVGLVAVARLHPVHVVRRMTVEVPFLVAAAALPFTVEDGTVLGITVGFKITIGVLAMIVLSSTTPFPQLLRGFELLWTPRLIIVIVAFMWRYLHVLAAEVSSMQRARTARGYSARWFGGAATSTGALVSTLFVRSLERGERVYLAMLSRGYNGSMPATTVDRLTLRRIDVYFLLALAATLLLTRVLLP